MKNGNRWERQQERVDRDLERTLDGVFAGMPCSNRVNAEQKAALDRWFKRDRADRPPNHRQVLKKLRRD
jgi:hypothetical protein